MIIVPVILAGGIGERFWPFSRSNMPKQLLPIISDKSMVEETIARVSGFTSAEVKPLIVTGQLIASKIKKVLPKEIAFDMITEPVGKNTAPAVAAAAAFVYKKYGSNAVMVILSADHAISPEKAFVKDVKYAAKIASTTESLVVFGINPGRPDTGYGYIQTGTVHDDSKNGSSKVVKKFVEKPDLATAKKYVKGGNYLWNSGMFVWRTDVIMHEFRQSMPDVYTGMETLINGGVTKKGLDTFYQNCRKESIDYGIMEQAKNVIAVMASFSWDDIGSWESLSRVNKPDALGTVTKGKSIYQSGCTKTIVAGNGKITVAAAGLDNVVVVAVDDAVLVISRDELPNIKAHMSAMKADKSFSADLF